MGWAGGSRGGSKGGILTTLNPIDKIDKYMYTEQLQTNVCQELADAAQGVEDASPKSGTRHLAWKQDNYSRSSCVNNVL